MFPKGEISKIFPGNIRLTPSISGWLDYAYQFKRSAALLYEDMLRDDRESLHSYKTKEYRPIIASPKKVYLLMIGLALENLLKGLYLTNNPNFLEDGEIKERTFKTHNVLQIASEYLKLQLTKDEKELLKLASVSIEWLGRYHIPLRESKTIVAIYRNDKRINTTFLALFDRLREMLKN